MAEDVKLAATGGQDGTTASTDKTVVADTKIVDTTATTDAKPAAGLLADGGDAVAEKAVAVPVDFPEDWRQKLAGTDDAGMKVLSRYSSPNAFYQAHRALQAKLSSGELKPVIEFPASGDDKAKAEWRKQNGLPETPEGYEPKVEGLVFGDTDKPMLDSFKNHAFGKNWSPQQFNDALSWYAAEQEAIQNRQVETDEQFREESRDALYAEWGPQDFNRNRNAIKSMFNAAPDGLRDRMFGARLSDGRLLGDDPAALKYFAQLAREINPAATLVPAGTSDAGKTVQAELDEIRRVTRETPEKVTPAMEKRQTELIEVVSKMKSRAA